MSLFIDPSEISSDELLDIITRSYKSSFRVENVVRREQFKDIHLLELFHGPTFSFKDVALQFLGNMFEFFLSRKSEGSASTITVLGATSGDTGSAAIHGLRGKAHVDVFVLHPRGRTSPLQLTQMTTVTDPNVHNVSYKGTFDDCQDIVKACFRDLDFKKKYHLASINSINWGRILAQIVYYFYTALHLPDTSKPVCFSVPTGNFGDILAGHYARRMGLNISKLVVATNTNNILHRFFSAGEYHKTGVVPTFSPSMDIQVASNLERFLHYILDGDSEKLNTWLSDFSSSGKLTVEGDLLTKIQSEMLSGFLTDEDVLKTMKEFYEEHSYILDPHTAIGVAIGRKVVDTKENTLVCLATAHWAKFEAAVKDALGSVPSELPAELASLAEMESRCESADTMDEVIEIIKKVSNHTNA